MSASKLRPKKAPKKRHTPRARAVATATRWSRALADQKPILIAAILYVAAIAAESIYCDVPLAQFMRIGYIIPLIIIKCIILLVSMAGVLFLRGFFKPAAVKKAFSARASFAWAYMDRLVQRYLDGDVFAYACFGLVVVAANGFYFIQKSLVHVLHPYAWDDAFIAADKFLHFGHQPNEFVVAITQTLHLGHFLDACYFLWFVVMYLGLGYTLFWDNDLKRRLRFLGCFLLSWILLGSVLAVWFSAAGPLFYHNFFPHQTDPYAGFVAYINDYGPHDFPIAFWSGQHLLMWTTNGEMVNLNAVAAFPSLHLAIAWLSTLYAFSINRRLGYAGIAFCVAIYFATILFGYHYALDGYVSILCVSLMWWGTGRLLDRRYPGKVMLKRI